MHLRFSAHFEAYRKNPLTRLWNCKSLAAELGCGEKAIGKDLATMKESLGYPLQFFPAKHGWMYTEPFTPVLAPSITESELARIFLAFRAIEALKASPVGWNGATSLNSGMPIHGIGSAANRTDVPRVGGGEKAPSGRAVCRLR